MTTPEPGPRPPSRTWRALVLWACGLGLGVLGGYALFASSEGTGVLLDARLPVGSEGSVFAFTITEPTSVRVWVHVEGCEQAGEAMLGPLLPALRPHLVYEPDASLDLRFPIEGRMATPQRRYLAKPGIYAVRSPGLPGTMGPEELRTLHVIVERDN